MCRRVCVLTCNAKLSVLSLGFRYCSSGVGFSCVYTRVRVCAVFVNVYLNVDSWLDGLGLDGMDCNLRFRPARSYPCRKAQIAVDIPCYFINIRKFDRVARIVIRVFFAGEFLNNPDLRTDIHTSDGNNQQVETRAWHTHVISPGS